MTHDTRSRDRRVEHGHKVLRRASAEYLQRSSTERIAEAYRRAYGKNRALGREFDGWENEASWPEK